MCLDDIGHMSIKMERGHTMPFFITKDPPLVGLNS